MLATFVIGLREGLEAALIVGIVAAFLVQDGRRSALRAMWTGVAVAVVICLGIGLALTLLSGSLPQRQQEMLETVIGAVAVVMVTWMVLWMRRHARDLKRELGDAVQGALARGSSLALVAMAFLAVIREGVETAVFLVAASQTRGGTATFVGAGLGLLVAVGLGLLLYRGGVRIDLSRFFRVTGAVLVLVAGGVLMSTLQHAHEADWITAGTRTAVDLSAVLAPGSVAESLLGGIFGVQAQLSAIAVIGWLLYVLPMMLVVLWPPRRPLAGRTVGRVALATGVLAAVAALALRLVVTPPVTPASTTLQLGGDGDTAALTVTVTGDRVTVDRAVLDGADVTPADPSAALVLTGGATVDGRSATTSAAPATPLRAGQPRAATRAEIAELNGGRLPVGIGSTPASTAFTVTPAASAIVTVQRDAVTGSVLGASVALQRNVLVAAGSSVSRLAQGTLTLATPAAEVTAAARSAAAADAGAARAQVLGLVLPVVLWVWAALLLVAAALLLRRRTPRAAGVPNAPDARTPDRPTTDPRDRRPAVAASAPPRAGDTPA